MKNVEYDELLENEYWEKKVRLVAKISYKAGFPEQNEKFWKRQPAGVISMIIKATKTPFPYSIKL